MKIKFRVNGIFDDENAHTCSGAIMNFAKYNSCDVETRSVKVVFEKTWCKNNYFSVYNLFRERDFWATLYLLLAKPDLGKRILNLELDRNWSYSQGGSYLISLNLGFFMYWHFFLKFDGKEWTSWNYGLNTLPGDISPNNPLNNTKYLYCVYDVEILRKSGLYTNEHDFFLKECVNGLVTDINLPLFF